MFERRVFRVQDQDGRGPFRPGLSCRWRDPDGNDFPPIQIEFGLEWCAEIPAGWHCGCAFRALPQMMAWFSPWECDRLDRLGYRLVALSGCRVLRESDHQLIVARERPFRAGRIVIAWPHRLPAKLDPWMEEAQASA